MTTLKPVRSGWHWSFGYLRRVQLDGPVLGYAYEAPDGKIMYSKDTNHRHRMHMTALRGQITDELTIVPSRKGTYNPRLFKRYIKGA